MGCIQIYTCVPNTNASMIKLFLSIPTFSTAQGLFCMAGFFSFFFFIIFSKILSACSRNHATSDHLFKLICLYLEKFHESDYSRWHFIYQVLSSIHLSHQLLLLYYVNRCKRYTVQCSIHQYNHIHVSIQNCITIYEVSVLFIMPYFFTCAHINFYICDYYNNSVILPVYYSRVN